MHQQAEDGITLRQGGIWKGFGALLTLRAIASIVAFIAVPQRRDGTLGACAFVIPFAVCARLEMGRVTVVTPSGATSCSAFGKVSTVPWQDLERICFQRRFRRFVLQSRDGTRVCFGGACSGIAPVAQILAKQFGSRGGKHAVARWRETFQRAR